MSAHGCISPCPTCKNGCPICHPCDPVKHNGLYGGIGYPPRPFAPTKPQKCDLCGSTAIDHTEMHCQMNRLNNRLLGNALTDLKPSDSSAMSGDSKSPSSPPNNDKEVIKARINEMEKMKRDFGYGSQVFNKVMYADKRIKYLRNKL